MNQTGNIKNKSSVNPNDPRDTTGLTPIDQNAYTSLNSNGKPGENSTSHRYGTTAYTTLGPFASVSPYIIHVDLINYGRKQAQDRLMLTNKGLPLDLHEHPMHANIDTVSRQVAEYKRSMISWPQFFRTYRSSIPYTKLDPALRRSDTRYSYKTINPASVK